MVDLLKGTEQLIPDLSDLGFAAEQVKLVAEKGSDPIPEVSSWLDAKEKVISEIYTHPELTDFQRFSWLYFVISANPESDDNFLESLEVKVTNLAEKLSHVNKLLSVGGASVLVKTSDYNYSNRHSEWSAYRSDGEGLLVNYPDSTDNLSNFSASFGSLNTEQEDTSVELTIEQLLSLLDTPEDVLVDDLGPHILPNMHRTEDGKEYIVSRLQKKRGLIIGDAAIKTFFEKIIIQLDGFYRAIDDENEKVFGFKRTILGLSFEMYDKLIELGINPDFQYPHYPIWLARRNQIVQHVNSLLSTSEFTKLERKHLTEAISLSEEALSLGITKKEVIDTYFSAKESLEDSDKQSEDQTP